MTLTEVGKFESLNFIIDHESLDFIGYEFKGREIEIEEVGCEQSLFRMDVDKKTNEITVYSAYSGDFDVMEEISFYFNTKELLVDIMRYMEINEIDNQGEVYVRYRQLIAEGIECDVAISMAYSY